MINHQRVQHDAIIKRKIRTHDTPSAHLLTTPRVEVPKQQGVIIVSHRFALPLAQWEGKGLTVGFLVKEVTPMNQLVFSLGERSTRMWKLPLFLIPTEEKLGLYRTYRSWCGAVPI